MERPPEILWIKRRVVRLRFLRTQLDVGLPSNHALRTSAHAWIRRQQTTAESEVVMSKK